MSVSGLWSRRVGWPVTSSSVDAMFKRVVVMAALVSMLFQQNVAHAQAAAVLEPLFNGVINRAIGAGILANLERRGLVTAANDAVFQNTMRWVGQAANDATYASVAASAVATVMGAPVWMSTAIGIGALAAVGAVAWGTYELMQTGTTAAPSLTLTPTTAAPPGGASAPGGASSPGAATPPSGYPSYPVAEVPVAGGVYAGVDSANNPYAIPGYQTIPASFPLYIQSQNFPKAWGACANARDCAVNIANYDARNTCANYSSSMANCVARVGAEPDSYQIDKNGMQMPLYRATLTYLDLTSQCYPNGVSGAAVPCQATDSWMYMTAANPISGLGPQPVTGNLADLPITSDMLSAPLPNQLTAQLADSLWQKAVSLPGYNGAPYTATNPVASADVATASTAPTWGDLVEGTPRAPTDTGVTIAPDYYPTPSGGTGGTPTSSQCDPNSQLAGCVPLGSAPASGVMPASEASISLTPWNIGSVDGTCPEAQTVTILGTEFSISFDPLCTVVQKLRPIVLALCALAAAFIVAMGVSL